MREREREKERKREKKREREREREREGEIARSVKKKLRKECASVMSERISSIRLSQRRGKIFVLKQNSKKVFYCLFNYLTFSVETSLLIFCCKIKAES